MKLAHVALWTRDLDLSADFWRNYFGAVVGAPYHSTRRPGFTSRFVSLPDAAANIELMCAPWIMDAATEERIGWDHIAISLGSASAVDALAARCEQDGILLSSPRKTGDGYYEAVIASPDGAAIEITS